MTSGLPPLKSKESRSHDQIPDVALAEVGHHRRRMLQGGETEERRGRCAQRPLDGAEALFDLFLRCILILGVFASVEVLGCDQVCEPMTWPAAATCFRISGCQVACSPIGKKMPVVHSFASAFSTFGVFSGHGPSSKVKTTSLSRRKSICLKCSNPNPGPPVVSISTTRPMPSASGLLQGCFAGETAGITAGGAGEVGRRSGRGWSCSSRCRRRVRAREQLCERVIRDRNEAARDQADGQQPGKSAHPTLTTIRLISQSPVARRELSATEQAVSPFPAGSHTRRPLVDCANRGVCGCAELAHLRRGTPASWSVAPRRRSRA